MNKRVIFIIIMILSIGIVYRLILTSNGNFLFNMDNGRDMVDVREMVILGKLRLIGPTSAVEGFFNGPAWYYLLAVPYIISGGNPYASILMEIILWAVGGFFLLLLLSRFRIWVMVVAGSLWIASNYVILTNLYAFNPNPVTLLAPLLIFLIDKYITTGKFIFSVSMWFLGGLFFNFEMNAGVFIPPIIIFSILLCKKTKLIKSKNFWIGVAAFLITLAPQLLFDLRHQFIMSKSIVKYLAENQNPTSLNPYLRVPQVFESFYSTLSATLMNQKILAQSTFVLFLLYLISFLKKKEYFKNTLATICLLFVLVPFLGYLLLPVGVNAWHLGGSMVALIILLGIIFSRLFQLGLIGRLVSLVISGLIIFYAISNLRQYFTYDRFQKSMDPSLFKNETLAIDYVYKYANGLNFKVYTYLPSVYDYPYQYLFWWYGQKRYGYIPSEYAYSPNKPQYISNKEKFEGSKDNFSGLVFLIKEPDRIKLRQAWENDFKNMEFISKGMIGPLEIEVRREVLKP